MALIQCEDCGKDISDLAPACIHCGRPRVPPPDSEPEARLEVLKRTGQYVLHRSTAAAGSWLESLRTRTSDIMHDAGDRLGDLSAAALERLFESRSVEVLVLPLGSGTGEFQVHLDLRSVLEELKEGVLVRPRLDVWVHRDDLDRGQLASALEQAFSRQVSEFRARQQEAADERALVSAADAEADRQDARHSGRWAKRGAIAAGAAMLLVTNPLLDLALLLLAVTAGADALLDVLRESRAEQDAVRAKRDHDADTARIGAAVRAKRKAFRVALQNVVLHVHPALQQLAGDYAELDDSGLAPQPVSDAPYPDVIGALSCATYVSALPTWYHPLLEGRLEAVRGGAMRST